MLVGEEVELYHWVARFATGLAIMSGDLPPHLQSDARKTLDEFLVSSACSETLAGFVREGLQR
jgi:hypothetical protein